MNIHFSSNKRLIKKLSAKAFFAMPLSIITIAFAGGCAQMNTSADAKVETTTMVNQSNTEVLAKLKANLEKSDIEGTIKSVEAISDSGLYWVKSEDTPSFMTNADGKYVIQGDVVKIGGDKPIDVSAKFKYQTIKESLNAVKIEDMIIFTANPKKHDKPKAVVYVFTDSTCYYCQKLHADMDRINDLGIEVRYLASPRRPSDFAIAEAIWCNEDRNQAMTDAKQEKTLPMKTCDSPVVEQVELGNALGVQGTPSIFNEDGKEIGGYLTPEKFVDILKLK